jgi:hypothetical protein
MQNDERIQEGILQTYKSIISVLKNMPGMRVEDLFEATNINELIDEKEYLEKLFKQN